MFLFFEPDAAHHFFLNEEESWHGVKTLRLGRGDHIWVTNGKGVRFEAVIENPDPRRCLFRIVDQLDFLPRRHVVQLAVSPTKSLDRMEWLIEKAVELGVEEIHFFISRHSERRVLKTERLEKVAIAAMKQSLHLFLPRIYPLTDFRTMLALETEQRFIAHLPDHEPPIHLMQLAGSQTSALVLIGPEGGFSNQEIEAALAAGFQSASLGGNRLRTETAALAACHILNLINEVE